MILFLNKKDLFAEKIKKVPITNCVCFANYSGPNEYNAASEFIKQAFEDSNKSPDSMQSITAMNQPLPIIYVLYATCCRCHIFLLLPSQGGLHPRHMRYRYREHQGCVQCRKRYCYQKVAA